jgi:hypothetical protein
VNGAAPGRRALPHESNANSDRLTAARQTRSKINVLVLSYGVIGAKRCPGQDRIALLRDWLPDWPAQNSIRVSLVVVATATRGPQGPTHQHRRPISPVATKSSEPRRVYRSGVPALNIRGALRRSAFVGFRTPAHHGPCHALRAGVRKPPKNETAGEGTRTAPSLCRAMEI